MPLHNSIRKVKMAVISGKWSPVADTLRLRRSSQAVSVIGNTAYVFGGELRSREPIDDKIDIIDLEGREGQLLLRLQWCR